MTSDRNVTSPLRFDPRAFTAQSFNASDPREKAYAEGWPQFCAWYEDKAREHHEFTAAAQQLATATHDDDPKICTARQWAVLWNCWRAASWKSDPFFDERVFADELLHDCARLIGPPQSPEVGVLLSMARAIERSGVAGERFSEHVTAAELRELRERLARALEALTSVAFLERWQHGPLLYCDRDGKEGRTRLPNVPTMLAAQLASFFQGRAVERKWQLITRLVAISGLGDDISEESLRVSAGKVLDLVGEDSVKIVGWPADVRATFDEMQRLFSTIQ